jgi:hypothetical protein
MTDQTEYNILFSRRRIILIANTRLKCPIRVRANKYVNMKPQSKMNEKRCLKLTDHELILFLDIRKLHAHFSSLCILN